MEYNFRQSYIDTANNRIVYGTKKIKVDNNFTYVTYNDLKSELQFIRDIKFGNEKFSGMTAGQDIEKHVMFRADGFDDFVIIRRFNGNEYVFDRIDFMNVEYRL